MTASAARIEANRRNAQLSTGPRTDEGKQRSRRNGLRHGLAGEGVVMPEADAAEVARRDAELQAELAPRSAMGKILVGQLARLSVRMERSGAQEAAAIELRVAHAADDFDRDRLEEADRLLDVLGEEPRRHLRRLRRSPEGVERLIEAWHDLRADLTREPRPSWTAWHLERAANLTGVRAEDAGGSEVDAWSKAACGDFSGVRRLGEVVEDEEAAMADARARLAARIDAEVAALEAHYETLDFEGIELDRAGAPARALFDPSREATLARRYESESTRGFYKALKELRRVESEFAESAASSPPPPPPPGPRPVVESLGSSRAGSAPDSRDRRPAPDPWRPTPSTTPSGSPERPVPATNGPPGPA